MNTYLLTYHDTGESRKVRATTMMVAPNGVIFLKRGKDTVFASGSTEITVELEEA